MDEISHAIAQKVMEAAKVAVKQAMWAHELIIFPSDDGGSSFRFAAKVAKRDSRGRAGKPSTRWFAVGVVPLVIEVDMFDSVPLSREELGALTTPELRALAASPNRNRSRSLLIDDILNRNNPAKVPDFLV